MSDLERIMMPFFLVVVMISYFSLPRFMVSKQNKEKRIQKPVPQEKVIKEAEEYISKIEK